MCSSRYTHMYSGTIIQYQAALAVTWPFMCDWYVHVAQPQVDTYSHIPCMECCHCQSCKYNIVKLSEMVYARYVVMSDLIYFAEPDDSSPLTQYVWPPTSDPGITGCWC